MSQMNAPFAFGKNWDAFVKAYYSDERCDISKQHILRFLGVADLCGRTFLDVGCGSGLSSLAALRAGAQRVISFDVDADSVATTRRLWDFAGRPEHWTILHGSVLDRRFLETLEPADVVYSWGVLHHTGAMWQACENVLTLVRPQGVVYVALYTTTPQSPFWIRVKQAYNRSSPLRKRGMEAWYVGRYTIMPFLLRGKNPFSYMAGYKRSRGMAYLTDVRDWLGGWPYEDAAVTDVLAFFRERGFQQVNLKTGEANSEYLLARTSTPAQDRD
jgi:SAM-dependent methyltransferase